VNARAAERAMALSLVEGVFYALMVGFGETYFLADAVRLGASTLEQGLVVTLPLFTGAAGSLLALRLMAGLARRRPLVIGTTFAQSLLLAALAGADAWGAMTPRILIGASCLYHMCGQAAGTAWSSWYGDLVPPEVRGRYFSRRNRFVHLATCLGLVGAGVLLQTREPGAAGEVVAGAGGAGFRAIFVIAAAARLVSSLLLAVSPEPRFRGIEPPARMLRFLATRRGGRAWRLLGTGASLQLLVYIGSPYFAPFMLEALHFTYLQYMAATVTVVVFKVAFVRAWGRLVDSHGARQVYAAAALAVALVPLPWLWAGGLGWVVVAQAMSGASWAGYEVSLFSGLLESSTKGTRPYLFSGLNVLNGSAQLLGGLAGAVCLDLFSGAFRAVFAVTLVARLALAVLVPRLIPPPRAGDAIGRGAVLMRVIGFRPHGGLVHRPIAEDEEP